MVWCFVLSPVCSNMVSEASPATADGLVGNFLGPFVGYSMVPFQQLKAKFITNYARYPVLF